MEQQVATISGTTVSFGATGTFTSNSTNWTGVTYDTENNKVVGLIEIMEIIVEELRLWAR